MENRKELNVVLCLYQIFLEKTDASHVISLASLIDELEERGIHAERKTIYKYMQALNDYGFKIHHVRRGKPHFYYMEHPYTLSEAVVLIDHISSSPAFSSKETDLLTNKIKSQLSTYQAEHFPHTYYTTSKTDNDAFLENIETLLPAIASCTAVEFQYYDLTIDKKRKYRKNDKIYHLTPYAIVSSQGKYYAVFYDEKHENFSNYRLDKIDHIRITDEKSEPIPFSLEEHMKTSMQMYHGKPATVSIEFDTSMANPVLEQFGDNLIISKRTDTTFVANIKTTLSPTLTSWLIQYHNRLHILRPQSLRKEMRTIALELLEQYKEE